MKFKEAYVEHSSKHRDYFEIYDELFQNINRYEAYKILEIGIAEGHGLRALKKYFPNSQIVGLDITKSCSKNEEENINVVIGSQIDDKILENLSEKKFDIIIDDGSHDNFHVPYTFNKLFKSLNNEKVGLYIVEDIHTSYWSRYNGGLKLSNSMIEKFKNIIDITHLWCVKQEIKELTGRDETDFKLEPVIFDQEYIELWVKYVQFYENILVIKKRSQPARKRSPL